MKKLLLATAIAALSVSAANAAPTVYGKAFITTDYVNSDDNTTETDSLQINSNSSRIGFKGSEAMTANTDVVYQLEYNVDIDNDRAATFVSRDTYLGLNNDKYGEFRFGNNTSSTDYINNVLVADGYYDNQDSFMADSGRRNNSILWKAPTYNGLPLSVYATYSADETAVESSSDRNNGYGVSGMYDAGTGFTAGVSYDSDLNIAGDLIRGTASVDMSKFMSLPLTVGALYQVADYDDAAEDETGVMVSAKLGLTNFAKPTSVYAQYIMTSDKDGVTDADADQFVMGGKYSYQPNMIVHAYAGTSSFDVSDTDTIAVGGGLEYLF